MCKSFEVSLATFFISMICVSIIWTLNSEPSIRWICIFIISFSLMQVVDAGLWLSLKYNFSNVNIVLSRYFVPLILIGEILVAYYGAVYYMGYRNKIYEIIMWLFVGSLLLKWITSCNSQSIKASNGYLSWCGTNENKFFVCVFVCFLIFPFIVAYPNNFIKYIFLFIGISTFILNVIRNHFSSRWCWSVNILSIILLILVLLKIYIKI